MIFCLPMLAIFHASFAMFSLCYVKWLGYLFCIMFPTPNIWQHYVEFDVHMLKKLLGARYFGCSISHLTHCQVIFLASSGKLHFQNVVWIVTPHIFGMLGIIIIAFVIHFQQDDHPIFLDVIAHVETNISLFQITLQDTRTMLPQGVRFQVPPFET